MKNIKFIDLFAGLGGTRIGFEQACEEMNISSECVFTSEIKPYAVEIYKHNFSGEKVFGDITKVKESDIPDFDFLLAGFPCQAFSTAGRKAGFDDARGTLFFDVARIIKEKRPSGILLENVEGLVTHDRKDKDSVIGNTLETILDILKGLDYKVSWKVLDAKLFGIPQTRKRIYIVGSLNKDISLDDFQSGTKVFNDIQEKGLPPLETDFTKRLLKLYQPSELEGKAIKDKRGGANNIHSWDLELKGALTKEQKGLMSTLLKERRKKKWALLKGIVWMDGMPLTLDEIHSFYSHVEMSELKELLDDMVTKKYLRFEHPKELIISENGMKSREYALHAAKGYNIVTGKLSFELNKILGKKCISPTIVATEADRIGVLDNNKIRRISERECLRFFGFPEWYESNISHKDLYDLIGNTVVTPVIKSVSHRVIGAIAENPGNGALAK
ncbi:DNA-cytosine methyltransferase [Bathymodiolus heckerae thiotrophic gill symbiont]|uniref:DNA (cytosine-5-)-methyltransferase n=1 Tax=Bathymodiolus heckerae thiotrophic gill symbiont TaxID=1052212 RepID=UPI0010B5B667|nr:DNA (cytosine-5-)-methyltransferase [Bathymodiolus heckerae thiotrophic gill symbiont]SHN93246.1 DNA-cytosine methyltransferase [Bathymodiolus heckerae thiotrophic gill symbiont]